MRMRYVCKLETVVGQDNIDGCLQANAKPRTFIPDTTLDESPVFLPQAACRPPMKRNLPPSPRSNESPWVAVAPEHMKRGISGSLGPMGSGVSFSNSFIISATGNSNPSMLGTLGPLRSTLLTTTSATPETPTSAVPSGSRNQIQSSSVTISSSSSVTGTQAQPTSVVALITNSATAVQASSTANLLHSSVVILAPSIPTSG